MGSTVRCDYFPIWSEDHPHIHGEHLYERRLLIVPKGSPPYTWGAQNWRDLLDATRRITPIYMGSTYRRYCCDDVREDHPHIHGEHFRATITTELFQGSPPYTWGALSANQLLYGSSRITPIYMGSTQQPAQNLARPRDHPHIHGEHKHLVGLITPAKGSPPYTWGALLYRYSVTPAPRITPIYMGSTASFRISVAIRRDHPHIHGEHRSERLWALLTSGSPPYTWGALPELVTVVVSPGITPIYMGSTHPHRAIRPLRWDHPHIHGEHIKRSL